MATAWCRSGRAPRSPGLPLEKFPGWNAHLASELFTRTKGSGAEVIKKKGGAGFAVGLAIQEVIEAIALDRRAILPVSTRATRLLRHSRRGPVGAHRRRRRRRAGDARDRALAEGSASPAQERPGAAANDRRRARSAQARRSKPRNYSSSNRIMQKSLDRKLAAIHADPSGAKDFILADAKDADMAFGIGAPGQSPEMHAGEVRMRTLAEYREQIRQIVAAGAGRHHAHVGQHATTCWRSAKRLFENSHVTPAARANDASDIFAVRGGRYIAEPSRPFRTAALDHIQCGHVDCEPAERARGANLGLYSVTFNNRLDDDLAVARSNTASSAKRPSARAFGISWKSSIPTRRRD